MPTRPTRHTLSVVARTPLSPRRSRRLVASPYNTIPIYVNMTLTTFGQAVPEGLERALPNSIHNTGD